MNPYRKFRKFLWCLSVRGFKRGPRLSRCYMYAALQNIGSTFPNKNGRVLSISHSEKLVRILGIEPDEIVSADYPEYNILNLDFPDNSFDFVLSDQVFEHIEGDPYQAVSECYRVLRPGGIAVHTSSTLIPIHKVKGVGDFWRFTPEGFSLLHKDWSQIISVGSWGNLQTLLIMSLDDIRYLPVPLKRWHPLYKLAMKNDPYWPNTIWIVARK